MLIEANAFYSVETCGNCRPLGGLPEDFAFHVRQAEFRHLILNDPPIGKQGAPLVGLNNWPRGQPA
jgi:hypothetical protein